jgi:hypothetical protein
MHQGEAETGIYAPAVHMHSAGAALTMIATFLRAGESNGLANAIQQCCARINSKLVVFAVNPQRDWDSSMNIRLLPNCRPRFVRLVVWRTPSNDRRSRAASHCQKKFPTTRV